MARSGFFVAALQAGTPTELAWPKRRRSPFPAAGMQAYYVIVIRDPLQVKRDSNTTRIKISGELQEASDPLIDI